MPDDDPSPHLEPGVVAAYAERRLSMADREAVERHLAACPECRGEVAQVVRIMQAPRRRWLLASGALAAAIALLVAFPDGRRPDGEAPLRSRAPESMIVALGPDSLLAGGGALRFSWRATEPGARYDFTLTADDGVALYVTATTDTGLVLPDSVALSPGRTYLWYVDALRADGRSASTGVRVLRVAP